jgi:chorismate lyase/3-hydroxybenzoate synthase
MTPVEKTSRRTRPAPSAPLSVAYVPQATLSDYLGACGHPLGVIAFGNADVDTDCACPRISLNLPVLGEAYWAEVWTSPTPVRTGREQGIRYAANDKVLFGAIEIAESDQIWLDRDTYRAVCRMLSFIKNQGYPHLLRIWNYLPDINARDNEIERYHLFCLGRHQAFFEHGCAASHDFPAASALGSAGGSLWIYFLASRESAVQQENPRQVSAYHYPRQHGPRSPSFARATLARWESEIHLYISGTASIVGHLSLHAGDVREQLGETLANIRALIAHTAREENVALADTHLALLKVYARRSKDFETVREMVEESVARDVPVLYLQADICRRELLLEIEGVCIAPAA